MISNTDNIYGFIIFQVPMMKQRLTSPMKLKKDLKRKRSFHIRVCHKLLIINASGISITQYPTF